jgi:hypothetical protein
VGNDGGIVNATKPLLVGLLDPPGRFLFQPELHPATQAQRSRRQATRS